MPDSRQDFARRRALRSIVGGSLGNFVEWYDWYVYSAFSVYFASRFFPAGDQTAQLLSTAAIFAVGFLVRPIGAWLMGTYADRHGRKAGLALSVSLMGGGSLLIGLMPTADTIGLAAPALLLLARLLQGLSVGGEYGASATYLAEMAGPRRRGLVSSWQYVTLIGGQLAALAVQLSLQAMLSETAMEQWGWRVPFVIGAMLALGVFYLRRRIDETADFAAARASGRRSGGFALVREHPREALLVIALTAGGTLAFYAYTTYMQKYLVNSAGFTRPQATIIMASALGVFMLMQPLFGALSDRIGRRPLLIGFGVAGTLLTVPLFTAIGQATSAAGAFGLVLAGLLVVSGYTSINAIVKAELFPPHIRALGVALPYAIANALFGGTAEYMALWLVQVGHEALFFYYVSGMCALSLIAYWRMRETAVHGAMGRG
ncbi:MFS transporter [Sphingobium lignivorans]|uniref:MHS family alpha-ketoglutarate permease-like MFS transporter n=1 Tax=Sphingobium lignivorans TaxID=2735886 RepID=A0ABR6NIF9_9SPHN|nr:MFS transporter [Sphingobium lignivorans]MBB5986303.1 MHS family alpha-ketoglutarate permease-like MFS transporter [Sphingobium lignivorans]